MTTAADAPTWDDLKDLLRWFGSLFGDPKRIYEDQVVKKKFGLIIRGWLAGLEAIARSLLMMMAAQLPKPEGRPQTPRVMPPRSWKPAGPPEIIPGVFEAPDSKTWTGVSFQLIPPLPMEGASWRASSGLPATMMRTKPLAYRLEALIRVIEKPERYAERLSRRLHAESSLALRVLHQPNPPDCRSFPRHDVAHVQSHGWLAYDSFKSDTG